MRSLLILGGLAVCVLLVTPSRGDRTEDGGGKMKTMDSETRRLVKRAASQQVCCPPWGEKPENCKPCPGRYNPMGRRYNGTETTQDEEMKTMDSETRKVVKRDAPQQVCCPRRGKKPKNCKPCPGRNNLMGRNYDGTATTQDEEMKTMDSETRKVAKRAAPQQVCCPPWGKKPENCKPCPGRNNLMGRRYNGTATTQDEEMKTMDSESRKLAKRDVPQQVCCPPWGKKPENCKPCPGRKSLMARRYNGTATTQDEEMKTMDSESRRLAKRAASQQVCCRRGRSSPKNCKPCPGRNSLMARRYNGTETTQDEEMKTMDSETRKVVKRDASQQVCCPSQGKKPKNCKPCRRRSLIGRNYNGTATTQDEEEVVQ